MGFISFRPMLLVRRIGRSLRGELGECVFPIGNDTLAENVPSRLLVEEERRMRGTRKQYNIL